MEMGNSNHIYIIYLQNVAFLNTGSAIVLPEQPEKRQNI